MRCPHREGFTLIELLVVVAIISLLIASVVPSMHRTLQQAYSTVCKSNLRDLNESFQMYRMDNRGWLPTRSQEEATESAGAWVQKLAMTNPAAAGVAICPADPWASVMRNNLALPSAELGDNSSYGLNDFITSSPDGFLAHLDRYQPLRPGETILLADMGPDTIMVVRGEDGEYETVGPSRNSGFLAVDDGFLAGVDPQDQPVPWLTGRHLGRINILTILGNVSEVDVALPLSRVVEEYYPICAAGQCTLCVGLELPHYSFAESRAYWWTGPVPIP